jgi:HPt (histidine-containing phosphotransfer) domain-containing protein
MRASLAAGDGAAAARVAHSMKTTAGIIGAEGLAGLARVVEEALRRDPGGDHRETLSRFEQELRTVVAGIDGALAAGETAGGCPG